MSALTADLSFSPLFSKLLEHRGLQDPDTLQQFITHDVRHLEDPLKMKGMQEAVQCIRDAVTRQQKILIHGDYDVDGVTATTILAQTLTLMQAQWRVFLPERDRDGYGVSMRAIEEAIRDNVALFITADCGISAHEQIQLARDNDIQVLVIDHHSIPEQGIPNANIILNPQQEDCPYPYNNLSAGGLAFKLSQALLGDRSFRFLDLAALSSVCDLAPLQGENRIIVKEGLKRFSETENKGLQALVEVSKIRASQINVGHLGFMVGPRINACGRMSTPEIALRLLTSDSNREVQSLALVLDEENKTRQKEERQIVKEAVQEVERVFHFNRDKVIVVGREGWHQGIVGIVASRLVEKFKRPAIVIGFKGEDGKGSGRSVKKVNLLELVRGSSEPLDEFGGHAQALGLSLKKSQLGEFRERLNQVAAESLEENVFVHETKYDLDIELGGITSIFVNELRLLEPHGFGNSRPVFKTTGLNLVGKLQRLSPYSIKFYVTDGQFRHEVIWSNREGKDPANLSTSASFTLFYHIKEKHWNGMQAIQLEAREIQFS